MLSYGPLIMSQHLLANSCTVHWARATRWIVHTAVSRKLVLGQCAAVKAAFRETDTDIFADSPEDIARVGRKDVGVSGESVSVSVSWNAALMAERY